MGKNDFDIDFDFEEEHDFDPKAFLGTEEYDDTIDLNAFSDEDLGLTYQKKADAAEEEDFDLDDDLDLDEFLNMGSEEETIPEEEPEEDWSDEAEEAEEAFEEEPELSEDEESEEIAMNENMEYEEDLEMQDAAEYEEEYDEAYEEAEENFDAYDEEDEEAPRKKRQKKARKPIKLPKITLPKIKLKTPNIFTKFFDLYFAPVLHKELIEEPQEPDAPRRRRRKSKAQIFKEAYLPAIIVCICLILVMTFLIGSVSNAIKLKQIENEKEQMQLNESLSAAAQAEQENQRILAQAEKLAAEYNYEDAITLLDSVGDLTQHTDLQAKRSEYINTMSSMVEYKDPSSIPNLSFHVLIHDMARALKDTDNLAGNYNKNFVTTSEFTKILEHLYNNGYVLVNFDSFVGSKTDINGNEQFEPVPIYLPADKKPVMITETMVNYFAYMVDGDGDGLADAKGDGFANKLVLDGNGDIKAEYVDANGQTMVGNYDLVPILEDFIKTHPGFSYRGARAILAVTGHEGVFGYRINSSVVASKGNDYWENEVAGAKQITNALREKGYTIACYTYKNDAYAGFSVAQIQADLQSWTTQITSVIGNVDTFVFAKTSNISDYSGSAFEVMYKSGFRYFISNADAPMTQVNPTYVRQNRLMVTGETMQHYSSRFTGLFDCAAILEVNIRGNVAKS